MPKKLSLAEELDLLDKEEASIRARKNRITKLKEQQKIELADSCIQLYKLKDQDIEVEDIIQMIETQIRKHKNECLNDDQSDNIIDDQPIFNEDNAFDQFEFSEFDFDNINFEDEDQY